MRGIVAVVAVVALALPGAAGGCRAMAPPPLLPAHTGTAAAPVGATTAMIVVGVYSQFLFGGDGVGLALRVEHQHTERTAAGVELGGGRGKEDLGLGLGKAALEGRRAEGERRHWLIAARGYARFSARDWLAATYGAGLSVMDTGALTLSAHGGSSLSYTNDYFVPVLSLGAAAAWPVLRGAPYGDTPARPRFDVFPYATAGFVVPIGSTGNRLSAELGVAVPLRTEGSVLSLSVADAHQLDP